MIKAYKFSMRFVGILWSDKIEDKSLKNIASFQQSSRRSETSPRFNGNLESLNNPFRYSHRNDCSLVSTASIYRRNKDNFSFKGTAQVSPSLLNNRFLYSTPIINDTASIYSGNRDNISKKSFKGTAQVRSSQLDNRSVYSTPIINDTASIYSGNRDNISKKSFKGTAQVRSSQLDNRSLYSTPIINDTASIYSGNRNNLLKNSFKVTANLFDNRSYNHKLNENNSTFSIQSKVSNNFSRSINAPQESSLLNWQKTSSFSGNNSLFSYKTAHSNNNLKSAHSIRSVYIADKSNEPMECDTTSQFCNISQRSLPYRSLANISPSSKSYVSSASSARSGYPKSITQRRLRSNFYKYLMGVFIGGLINIIVIWFVTLA